MVREGLKRLVHSQRDMEVVGEAGDADSAVRIAGELLPDVLVLDLWMPGGSGIDVAVSLRDKAPDVKVVILTAHEETSYVVQAFETGAAGYLLKRAAPDDLARAIRAVATGGTYLDPSIARMMSSTLFGQENTAGGGDRLSERERSVLIRIAQGFSNKEIAAALELSVKTVESYKSRIAEKLGLRSRVDIVRYAATRGWLGE